jgi:DNA-binding CsgD family transcriptional regulator
MIYRTRIKYTPEQKKVMWDRWSRGDSLKDIGRGFDRHSSSIYGILSRTGGIRPKERKRSDQSLSMSEREEISRGIVAQLSIRKIAYQLGRSPSTISREINRNKGYDHYRAVKADQAAWERSRRPKFCKLACNRLLQQNVAKKLKKHWSPVSISI